MKIATSVTSEEALPSRPLLSDARLFHPLCQECLEFIGWHWSGEEKTLRVIAACGQQQIPLLAGFHSLGNDLHAEFVCHYNDGLAQRQIIRIGRQVADEGLVDLEIVDVEFFEVGE